MIGFDYDCLTEDSLKVIRGKSIMVKENPNKESCRERMKELIRVKKLNRNQVVKRCMREFDDVHKSTFYGWYDEVINEPDIVSWEEDRKLRNSI